MLDPRNRIKYDKSTGEAGLFRTASFSACPFHSTDADDVGIVFLGLSAASIGKGHDYGGGQRPACESSTHTTNTSIMGMNVGRASVVAGDDSI